MTIQPTDDPRIRLGQFFDYIWGTTEGWVYLPIKSTTNEWRKFYYKWPLQRHLVLDHVLTRSPTHDVYYGPAIYKPEVEAKLRAEKKEDRSTTKEDILGSQVVWADYDGTGADDWATMAPQAVHGAPVTSLPAPSLRVQSSSATKQHCYWRLSDFTTDIDYIERVNRGIAYLTGADTSGWDINQVLRPIETVNHKYTNDNTVIVFDQPGELYVPETFSHFEPVKNYISDAIEFSELPSVEEILGKYTWGTDDLNLINKTKEDIDANPRDRSNALMRIGYTCAEMSLSDSESYALLLYLDDKWEKFKYRNDRQRQIVNIINRAKQRYPHGLEQPSFAGLTSGNTPVAVEERVIYTIDELLAEKIEINWMIDNLLPASGMGLIASAPNVGKTQAALGMAMACATTRSFLRWHPTKTHKVMFFSLEMDKPGITQFVRTMAEDYKGEERELLGRNFRLYPHGGTVDLMREEARKQLETYIETYKPDGIYIDSLQKIYVGKLNDDEVRGLFTYLQILRKKYGIYVIQVHHDRKAQDGNRKPRDLSDIYGSQFITAEPDFVLHMWKPKPNAKQIEFRELKNRYAPVAEGFVATRKEHLQFTEVAPGEEEIGNGLRESSDDGIIPSGLGLG